MCSYKNDIAPIIIFYFFHFKKKKNVKNFCAFSIPFTILSNIYFYFSLSLMVLFWHKMTCIIVHFFYIVMPETKNLAVQFRQSQKKEYFPIFPLVFFHLRLFRNIHFTSLLIARCSLLVVRENLDDWTTVLQMSINLARKKEELGESLHLRSAAWSMGE